VTLKTRLGVRQGHWKCHRSIERIYDFLLTFYIVMCDSMRDAWIFA